MEARCSFCDLSSRESDTVFQKGEASICLECLKLVKEILDEFSIGEVFEGGGECSFCKKEQGGARMVFKGKGARICNECVSEIEEQITGKPASRSGGQSEAQYTNLVKFRVKEGIRELSPYSVPHFKCRVKLDGNESPFSLPKEVLEKVILEIKEIPINRYPDPEARMLREKISKITDFPLDGIILGNGSDELIEMLMTTFSGGTGRVLYPVPTFSMFRITSIALGLEPIPVELDDGFDIDVKSMIKEIRTRNPDLVFLASPNNPTGNRFSDDRIFEILKHSSGVVVLDEAYCDFSGKSFLPLIQQYENLIVLRTMSKVGFAGIRLGILFGRVELIREINKVRLPYNVNSLSQRVAEVVLDRVGFVTEGIQLINRERGRVYRELKILNGVKAFPSDANFILFRVEDADGVFKGLMEKGVLIRNFNSPGRLENCLRVTIGTPNENNDFLRALREVLSS
ncbi:MAG: histidinol-phosphate transaminase [Deltaproteobacteria bacterium]|nr:histidinol-phosphate transaminase [Deltaproteobacteria bacterium]